MKARKEAVSNPDSSGPNSSSSRPPSPRRQPSLSDSPPDSDGWQNPSKVARRHSPTSRSGEATKGGGVLGRPDSGFQALVDGGLREEGMDLGLGEEASPLELVMMDQGQPNLKQARSPPLAIEPSTSIPGTMSSSSPRVRRQGLVVVVVVPQRGAAASCAPDIGGLTPPPCLFVDTSAQVLGTASDRELLGGRSSIY